MTSRNARRRRARRSTGRAGSSLPLGRLAPRWALATAGGALALVVLGLVLPNDGDESLLSEAVVWGVVAVIFGVIGLISWLRSRRRGEEEAPPPVERHDAGLGIEVVRSVRWPQLMILGLVLAPAALLVATSLADVGAESANVIGGAVVVVIAVATVGAAPWYQGRDGVWATATHLVARKRGQVQRWRWEDVLELGYAVSGRQAQYPVARVRPGTTPGVEVPGWIVIAKPLSGPLAGHRSARRLQALAEERDVPYTDGVAPDEYADGWFSPQRR